MKRITRKSDYSTGELVDFFYRKIEDKIGEPPIGLEFSFRVESILINEDTPKEKVEKVLIPSYRYRKGTAIILAYVQSLHELFPEWTTY